MEYPSADRFKLTPSEAERLADRFSEQEPSELLAWAIGRFGRGLGICSSLQAEGCVLIDMAWQIDPAVRVFTIDTGRMPAETLSLIDRIRAHYGIKVEVFFPDATAVQEMVTRHGVNLFYQELGSRLYCCQVRKVEPLKRALAGYDAWVTGLRREQAATRAQTPKLEIDHSHGGIAKFAPLADWTEAQVWAYIRAHDVPYNELYDQGYKSIGCAPCSRAVKPGEDPRAGRWWWEESGVKECGMHYSPSTVDGVRALSELAGK